MSPSFVVPRIGKSVHFFSFLAKEADDNAEEDVDDVDGDDVTVKKKFGSLSNCVFDCLNRCGASTDICDVILRVDVLLNDGKGLGRGGDTFVLCAFRSLLTSFNVLLTSLDPFCSLMTSLDVFRSLMLPLDTWSESLRLNVPSSFFFLTWKM